MKKTLFKTFLMVSAFALLFSSCLGDSHSKRSGGGIAYIRTAEASNGSTVKYAAVIGEPYPITSDYIKKLTNDRFYEIQFDINSKDGMEMGVYRAHTSGPLDGKNGQAIPMAINSFLVTDTKPEYENEYYPTSLSVNMWDYRKDALNDKYVVTFSCRIHESDEPGSNYDYSDKFELIAVYDKSNQLTAGTGDGAGDALEKNKVRINLVVRRKTVEGEVPPVINSDKKNTLIYTNKAVIDLSYLRTIMREHVTPSTDIGNKDANAWVQFQYTKSKDNSSMDKQPEPLGSLSDLVQAYRMFYLKEQ